MKKTENDSQALIFANGPYQLLVGLACCKKFSGLDAEIRVIAYDMLWQEEMNRLTAEYVSHFQLEPIHLPFEFRKSDISNFTTYRLRTMMNHILFFFYVNWYGKGEIYLPKLYGSPERAVILASLKKIIHVYDDGFGIYLDPKINERKLDRLLYYFVDWFRTKREISLFISPRKPSLILYSEYHGLQQTGMDYSEEMRELLKKAAGFYKTSVLNVISPVARDRIRILITLPRLTLSNQQELGEQIQYFLREVESTFPDLYFLFKPHPRDVPQNFDFLKGFIDGRNNCDILPKTSWSQPVEVLAWIIEPVLILSGTSTVGINQDLLPNVTVMVFDFLSFDLPYYNQSAKMIMKKAGTYSGQSVEDALQLVSAFLQNSLSTKQISNG